MAAALAALAAATAARNAEPRASPPARPSAASARSARPSRPPATRARNSPSGWPPAPVTWPPGWPSCCARSEGRSRPRRSRTKPIEARGRRLATTPPDKLDQHSGRSRAPGDADHRSRRRWHEGARRCRRRDRRGARPDPAGHSGRRRRQDRHPIVEVVTELAAGPGRCGRHRRRRLDRRQPLDRALRPQPRLAQRAAARLRRRGGRPAGHRRERRQRRRLGRVPVRRRPRRRRLDGHVHHRHRRRRRLVLGGELVRGAHGIAAELGHTSWSAGRPPVRLRPARLHRAVRQRQAPWSGSPGPAPPTSRTTPASCWSWPAATVERITGPMVTAAAQDGDPVSRPRSPRSGTGSASRWPTWRRSSTRRCWWSAAASSTPASCCSTRPPGLRRRARPARPAAGGRDPRCAMGNTAGVVGAADLARRR